MKELADFESDLKKIIIKSIIEDTVSVGFKNKNEFIPNNFSIHKDLKKFNNIYRHKRNDIVHSGFKGNRDFEGYKGNKALEINIDALRTVVKLATRIGQSSIIYLVFLAQVIDMHGGIHYDDESTP